MEALERGEAVPAAHLRALRRGRNIGIVPASIGFSVLDVDHGDPVRLAEAHEPAFFLDSRTPGRAHLGYDVGALRRDGTFEIEGCAGEVKVSGYVSLHGRERALERIHGAVAARPPYRYPNPCARPEARRGPHAGARGACEPHAGRDVPEGFRNATLFHVLRFWAYREIAGALSRSQWVDACQDRALQIALSWSVPEATGKIETTARSVAGWTWVRNGNFRALRSSGARSSPRWHAAQARRRWSAYRRRDDVRERDRRILEALGAGHSQRETAALVGCTRDVVRALQRAVTAGRRVGG